MGHLTLVLETINKMDTKELKRCFKASFKIKALEPCRPAIETRLRSRGVEPRALERLAA